MKLFNKFSKIAFLTLTLSMIVITTVKADVIKFVENDDIGLVVAHSISPNGKYIFSTTITPTFLRVYKRDTKTGEVLEKLQEVDAKDLNPQQVENPSFIPKSMIVSPDGKQLYIAASFDGEEGFHESVLRFDIGASGALTYINSVQTRGTDGLTISKSGDLLFVGDSVNGSRLSVVKREPNGDISTLQTRIATPGGGSENMSSSPEGKNLYVSSGSSDGHLFVYQINKTTGDLTLLQSFIPSNRKNQDGEPNDISVPDAGGSGSIVSDDGKFFYSVGGRGGNDSAITIMKRNTTNGTLSYFKKVESPILANSNTQPILGTSNTQLAISNDQKYIYAYSDNYSGYIGVWKRNQNTGDLSFIGLVKGNGLRDGASESFVLAEDGSTLNINVGDGISVYDLRADLSLVKTDSADPVSPSSTINYTLAVTNETGADAQNVIIRDTLPAGTSFISGSVNSNTGSCSANGRMVRCTMGQILSGDGYNAVIQIKAPSAQGQITNTATVTSDQIDQNTKNNTDSETTNIGSSGEGGNGGNSGGGGNGGNSGGGSIPLGILALLSLVSIRRFYSN